MTWHRGAGEIAPIRKVALNEPLRNAGVSGVEGVPAGACVRHLAHEQGLDRGCSGPDRANSRATLRKYSASSVRPGPRPFSAARAHGGVSITRPATANRRATSPGSAPHRAPEPATQPATNTAVASPATRVMPPRPHSDDTSRCCQPRRADRDAPGVRRFLRRRCATVSLARRWSEAGRAESKPRAASDAR